MTLTSSSQRSSPRNAPAATTAAKQPKSAGTRSIGKTPPATPTVKETVKETVLKETVKETVKDTVPSSNQGYHQNLFTKSCPPKPEAPKTFQDVNVIMPESLDNTGPRKTSKEHCPCNTHSPNNDWSLQCYKCKQMWHTSCCNLPGLWPESSLNSLTSCGWKCPWCYNCIHPRPKCHPISRGEKSLLTVSFANTLSESLAPALTPLLDERLLHILNSTHQPKPADLTSIEQQLSSLTAAVAEMKSVNSSSRGDTAPVSPLKKKDETNVIEHNCMPIEQNIPTFLEPDVSQQLLSLLDAEGFAAEGNRQVASYGEYYKYMGAKSKPKPFPQLIKDVMDRINAELTEGKYLLNQCLVNKYTDNKTPLPEHSDNEFSINPISSIFTVSLGSTRNIIFNDTHLKKTTVYPATHGSLYSMTRDSQNFIKHRVDPEPEAVDGVRYSLTFRCVHWTYLNSTLAIGDSNFGPIEFGEGKMKVGKSTPGKVKFAAHVADIKPLDCVSYRNVVLMVGTNDLKQNSVRCKNDVRRIYQVYKSKILDIQKLHPTCKLYICPVLPCKRQDVNNKIRVFNTFIFDDLIQTTFGVAVVQGFDQFLARNQEWSLSDALYKPDPTGLHINGGGTRLLVMLIKQCMYASKFDKGRISSNKTYRNALVHSARPP
jgi:hypothetical protein